MIASHLDIDAGLLRAAVAYIGHIQQGEPGDSRAWDIFYERCQPMIERFLRRMRVPADDLEDCAQDIWLRLLKHLPDFEFDAGRGRFSSWLYRLAHNAAMDRRRRASVRGGSEAGRVAMHSYCVSGEQRRLETRDLLANLAARLEGAGHGRYARVARMRYVDQRSVPDAAAEMGMSCQQLRVCEHRMRKVLRHMVADAAPVLR